MARSRTSTSRFGVSRREAHDASEFYARFAAPVLSTDDTVHPPLVVDEIITGDSRRMDRVRDGSVALVVTSPPYFAGKDYEAELGADGIPGSYVEYLQMLEEVFAECVRTLEPGGRIAVNVANLGRKPYRSLAADVTGILQDRLRLLMRGEIVWVKARGAGGSCAWGSFLQPANPVLRDLTERVVVASKGRFDRAVPLARRRQSGLPAQATITRDEFLAATLDVWELPPESATRVGHPAPFPVELPQRLIELYTYEDDLVLDPFMGSGSTAVAAVRTGRHYVGYDTDPAYAAQAAWRVALERTDPPVSAGAGAVGLARQLLTVGGFTVIDEKVKGPGGVEVALAATDQGDRRWLVDVVGTLSTGDTGLRRTDALWKLLGRASLLHEVDPKQPLLVLTTHLPVGPPAAALAALSGTGKPVTAVVALHDPAAADRLTELAAARH
jgi:DNA modification methylase